MKIIVCTNEDWIGNHILNLLLPKLAAEHEVRVLLSQRRWLPEDAPDWLQELDKIEYVYPIEKLFPQIDGEKTQKKTPSPLEGERGILLRCNAEEPYNSWHLLTFKGLENKYGDFRRVKGIKNPEAIKWFSDFSPDLILSLRFGCIFRDEHIRTSRYGIWNLHSGRLPRFRGVMATFRAMLENEDAGITMHLVPDDGIDTGPAIAMKTLPLVRGKSMLWHIKSLYPLGIEMIMTSIAELKSGGSISLMPPSDDESFYYSFPEADDINKFKAQGWQLYDDAEIAEWAADYNQLQITR